MEAFDSRQYEAINALCQRHHVAKLEVFDSAATGEFDAIKSDIDFLVEFDDAIGDRRFDNYFELQRALESLFGRSVDLVEQGGIRNPYFLRRLNETRRPVYAAS
jgi:predicted nucleotidyltransferase